MASAPGKFSLFVELIYKGDYFRLYRREFSLGYLASAKKLHKLKQYDYVFLERIGEEIIWFYSKMALPMEQCIDLGYINVPNKSFY